jgi:glutamyl-tRNA synthetase
LKWVNSEGEVSRGYREDGYYPEAFVNMLALLGWNPGTEQELFTLEELVNIFSLDRVIKSGAKFNPDKAKWFNQEYLRKQTAEQLAAQFTEILAEKGVTVNADEKAIKADFEQKNFSFGYVEALCTLIKERAHFVADFWDICSYFFVAPAEYAEKDVKKFWNAETKAILQKMYAHIEAMDATMEVPQIEEYLTGYVKENEWKMGAVMNTLRLFFVGEAKGLGIADIVYLIGKTETLRRISAAMEALPVE